MELKLADTLQLLLVAHPVYYMELAPMSYRMQMVRLLNHIQSRPA